MSRVLFTPPLSQRRGIGFFGSRASKELRENLEGYAFLLPWLIGFFVLTIGPMVASLYFSLTDYDLLTQPQWRGMDNYLRLFSGDKHYINALKVTIKYVFLSVPFKLAFALLLAVVLNRGVRGLSAFRAAYYLPSLLGGSVSIAILWRQLFGKEGLINLVLFFLFGIEGKSWIGSPDTALFTLIALSAWQFGSAMVIFLAGLKQIPRELYEASAIDGAGKVSQFLKITLPLLTPIILFNLIMQMIQALQAFTPAYIISGGSGGPADSTLFYTLYVYQRGFNYFRMGYASAMAWILLAITAAFTAVNFVASKRWVYYSEG